MGTGTLQFITTDSSKVTEIPCFGSAFIIQIEFQDGLTAGQTLYSISKIIEYADLPGLVQILRC